MNNYIIPANTKRGNLIFSIFRKQDLILFLIGLSITFGMLMFVPTNSTVVTILILLPALVTGVLVMPIPYYHNVLVAITEMITFFRTNQKLVWKGWCANDGDDELKK